jgi:hypothetical protein
MKIQEVETYADLLKILQNMTPEQLAKPVQTVMSHPVYEAVRAACPVICVGSVDELGLLYIRSAHDNRRHGDDIILFVDYNPFGVDGAIAYTVSLNGDVSKDTPIYPKNHTEDQNWTGPAQKLIDKSVKELSDGTLGPILAARIKNDF